MDRVYLIGAAVTATGLLLFSRGIQILWRGKATLADALPVFGLLGKLFLGSIALKGTWARLAAIPLLLLGITALAGAGTLLVLKRFKSDELDLVMTSAAAKLGSDQPTAAERKAATGEAMSGIKNLVLGSFAGTRAGHASDAAITVPEADLGPIAITEPLGEDFARFTTTPDKLSVVVFQVQQGEAVVKLHEMIQQVGRRFSNVAQVAYFDLDTWPELGEAQGVTQFPDVRFYRDGKQVDGFVGVPVKDVVLLEKFVRHSQGLTGNSSAPSAPNPADAALTASPQPNDPGTREAPTSTTEPAMQPMKKDWLPPGMERR